MTMPPPPESALPGFAGFGLDERLLSAIAALGYEEPTPVQLEAIPPLLAGRDLLAEAPTGTGKTAAFALPCLQRIHDASAAPAPDGGGTGAPVQPRQDGAGRPAGLVLVPTRELAMQVAEAIHRYGRELGTRVLPVYGGQPIGQQLAGLRRGVDVVVATPGRAVDHLRRGTLALDGVRVVILDEADEMLDMGFAEDLDAILAETPTERQTALFSATMSTQIRAVARRHLREPARVTVHAAPRAGDGMAAIRQLAYVVRRADKLAALCRILDVEDPAAALVFGRTRGEVDDLAETLSARGHDAAALHGGLAQEGRDRIMGRFRDGSLTVLVATDVAARGLDIDRVSHVVNFDVPSDPDAYVHRIGRTGRAGRTGVAITLVEPREHRLLRNIEAATHQRLEIARLPTVADLREHRAELVRGNLREALTDENLHRFRGVIEPLTDEFDMVDIALAAVSLIEGAGAQAGDEREITSPPLVAPPPPRGMPGRAMPGRSGPMPGGPGRAGPRMGAGGGHGPGPGFGRGPGPGFGPGPAPGGRTGELPRGPGAPGGRGPAGPAADGGWARLFVGGGRRLGLRPGDLVGAITNEAGVPGSVVGAIRIDDAFSLVDVQEGLAEAVIAALRGATIRGRRLPVRRDG